MKFGRSACLAGLVAMGAWSVAACSSDNGSTGGDGGTTEDGGGNGGSGGSGGSSGSSGSAGKGTGGSSGGSGAKTDSGAAGEGGDSGTPTGAPTIILTIPSDGMTVTTTKFNVSFKVTNFTLAAPGTGSSCKPGVCGHVHLNVDGNDCNVNAATPYNNAGQASPIVANLALCKMGEQGAHTLTVSLHNDDHSAVTVGDAGDAVQSSITVNAVIADAGSTDAGNDH